MTAGSASATKVLVVDDEENISFLVSSALRVEGFDVTTASSGRTGLSEAEQRRPDVIVLDVMLGDIDGFEVLRRLRASAGLASHR